MKTLTLIGCALLVAAPLGAAQAPRPDTGKGGPPADARPGNRPEGSRDGDRNSGARPGPRGDSVQRDRPSVSVGFYSGYFPRRDYADYRRYGGPYGGYYGGYYGNYGYYDGGYGYYSTVPVYGSYQVGSSYATDGLWLGALAGGIIGHNSGSLGHNGWRGAAWGAGLGWLLGSVADANLRVGGTEAPVVVAPPAAVVSAPQPAPVTVRPAGPPLNPAAAASPMAAANGLFGR